MAKQEQVKVQRPVRPKREQQQSIDTRTPSGKRKLPY